MRAAPFHFHLLADAPAELAALFAELRAWAFGPAAEEVIRHPASETASPAPRPAGAAPGHPTDGPPSRGRRSIPCRRAG